MGRLVLPVLALLLCGQAPARAPAAGASAPSTPAELYGPLFVAVQEQRIFADGKAFVDAVPRRSPDAIMADYRADPPPDPASLLCFVLANFAVPGAEPRLPLRAHVQALWPQLVRQPEGPPVPGSSRIALPAPYVVPGGRFREIYYWDSYFTMLGLVADGRQDLVEAMLEDFTSLIERYGHIPNGTRSYYLSRSQPPFFALMLDLSASRDPRIAARRLAALRREHAFWMAGADCARPGRPCARVVVMPDGSRLNRNWDGRDTAREESFAQDRATAAAAAPRPSAETYRDLRAAAESGWDFSSRWLTEPGRLASIRTTAIVPVDLNALLYAMERRIAERCRATGDGACAGRFATLADDRRRTVDRYLWMAGERRYADWDQSARRPTRVMSAAMLYPLFVGMASPAQAQAVGQATDDALLAPGGLRTTRARTGQQWDAPNGWAPLQWIAIDGLARYGMNDLARSIAGRWMATVRRTYDETGRMLEKYDVEERKPGGGGEYPLQDGFGWTNGIASAILHRYPELSATPQPSASD